MRIPRTAIGLVAVLAPGALFAQTNQQIVPALLARTPAGSLTRYPFGQSGPVRLQTIYEARETGLGSAVAVRALELRLDEDRRHAGKSGVVLAVEMSTTTARRGAVSPRFAANRGADHAVAVRARTINLPAAAAGFPGAFALRLPLDAPFRYDPRAGSLLIEYVVTRQPTGDYVLDTPSPVGLGAHRDLGGGCRGFLRADFGGIGHTITYQMWSGPANGSTLHVLGARVLPSPIPLPGNPRCQLRVDPVLLTPVRLDKNGHGRLPVPVPNNRFLISRSVFGQQVVVGARLEISNAVETMIGGPHGVTRVFSLGTTTAATGTTQDGAAHVVRLTY